MDNKPKQPNSKAAWGITWAAILDLLAFGFLIAAAADFPLLILFGAYEAMFIFMSVKAWKEYFENFALYEIEKMAKG